MLLLAGEYGSWVPFGRRELWQYKQEERLALPSLRQGPLVVLNACFTGRSHSYGGQREDLVSALIEEGAAAVVACPLPVHDRVGALFGVWLYTSGQASGARLTDNFMRARRKIEEHCASEDSAAWPLWTLLHYHGNPYAQLG